MVPPPREGAKRHWEPQRREGLTLGGVHRMAEHHERAAKRRASEEDQGRAAGIDEAALLATAGYVVDLLGRVFVRAVTAIELILLPISGLLEKSSPSPP